MGENAEAPVASDAPAPAGVRRVPIESLKPNPDQPRKTFRQEDLEELTASIRDKGVLQPILVRTQPGHGSHGEVQPQERLLQQHQQQVRLLPAHLREIP